MKKKKKRKIQLNNSHYREINIEVIAIIMQTNPFEITVL